MGVEEEIIKLSQNENPYGSSPLALQAAKEAIRNGFRYPDPHGERLRKSISERYQISESRIFVSAGLVAALDILIRCFVRPGHHMITGDLSFAAYYLLADVFGVENNRIPMKEFHFDLDAISNSVNERTDLIIIANPNNPTGCMIEDLPMRSFLDSIPPSVTVVIDEAYMEYVANPDYPDAMSLLTKYPNIAVMRTFSKIFGLAGYRAGYTFAHEDVVDRLYHYQAPFTVNHLASVAASAAIDDTNFVSATKAYNTVERKRLIAELREMNYRCPDSESNFIILPLGSSTERDLLWNKFWGEKISTRRLDVFGDHNSLRITVGKARDNDHLISVLHDFQKQRTPEEQN